MPKMKTHSASKKRFKVTGSGRVRRYRAFGSHILTKKSSKRKRAFRQSKNVDPSQERILKTLLPYS